MLVHVSGQILSFPDVCACCCGPANTEFDFSAVRQTGRRVIRTTVRSWRFPYCSGCVRHAVEWPAPWSDGMWILVIITLGVWGIVQAVLDANAQKRAKALCGAACSAAGAAVAFHGWQGSVKTFGFSSTRFATKFALANAKRLVSVDADLRAALDSAIEAEQERLTAEAERLDAEAARASWDAEEGLVADILAGIEKARGPASRRAALERGLSRLTRQDLRERVVVDAAKIEVRAVLDKADSLKSKAAKRRYLEEGLAALRDDQVSDELQEREIALLEEALRELNAEGGRRR